MFGFRQKTPTSLGLGKDFFEALAEMTDAGSLLQTLKGGEPLDYAEFTGTGTSTFHQQP